MMVRITTIALTVFLALPIAVSADEKKPEAAAQEMDSASMAMMAEWEKYSTPGAEHQHLAKQVGRWTYTNTMWMDPTQPPTESKGTCETMPLLGGRFFRSVYSGDFGGMPYEGIWTAGYNLYTKTYENTWMDNLGTLMITSTGTANADGSISCAGSYNCPMTKKVKKFRDITKWTSPDSYTITWFETVGDGPENKTMEIVVARAK